MPTAAFIAPFTIHSICRHGVRYVGHSACRRRFHSDLFTRSCNGSSAASFRRVEQRSYLTETIEPDLDITNGSAPVKEIPCSLILAEDFETVTLGYVSTKKKETNYAMRQQHSWHDSFSKSFPNLFGIPYTKFSLSIDQVSFDVALSTMKNDLSSSGLQQPVLVTRGPVMCWLAQFYLESLPLSGLVMVDPLPFDTKIAVDLYERYFNKLFDKDEDPTPEQKQLFSIIEDYINHWDHYTLKLESGVIPMMVISTMLSDSMRREEESDEQFYSANLGDEDGEMHTSTFPTSPTSEVELDELYLWRNLAERTSSRHSRKDGEVPLLDLDPHDVDHCGAVIKDWIKDKVL